ncbi:MAG TPA: OmpA family protein [Terriglobales bacterium]|nr:OmpA family protein [Terriglobales bacterium]
MGHRARQKIADIEAASDNQATDKSAASGAPAPSDSGKAMGDLKGIFDAVTGGATSSPPTNTSKAPDTTPDLSDVPGSFAPGEQLAANCPDVAPSANHGSETATIPLRPGMTWVNAWRRFNGDVEVINKIEAITPNEVDTSTSGLGFATSDAVYGTEANTTRHVCRADLQDATTYLTETHQSLPQIVPQTTTFSVSRKSFQALKTSGKFTILYQEFEDFSGRMVPVPRTAELTRAEPGDIHYPVILNRQPTTVPVIHVRGRFQFSGSDKVRELYKSRDDLDALGGDGEIFVLDDAANPMVLQFGFGPVFQMRVISVSSPEEKPKPQIEDALANEKKAVIYGIYFDFNKASIKKESEPVLKEIADAMKNHPDWVLTVNGYTDNIGGDAYNLDLSKRRAEAVKQALVSQYNIARSRLTPGGFGAASPVDTNDTLEGRARNRRVELIRQ